MVRCVTLHWNHLKHSTGEPLFSCFASFYCVLPMFSLVVLLFSLLSSILTPWSKVLSFSQGLYSLMNPSSSLMEWSYGFCLYFLLLVRLLARNWISLLDLLESTIWFLLHLCKSNNHRNPLVLWLLKSAKKMCQNRSLIYLSM